MIKPCFELNDKVLNSHHLVVPIVDLAKNRGADPEQLLRGTGIFYQDIKTQSTHISCAQFFKLIANIEKLNISNDLSFLAGRRFFPGNLGTVGQLLMNGDTLTDTLKLASVFQHLVFPLTYFRVEHYQQHTFFILNDSVITNHTSRFLIELVCSAFVSACKWRSGKHIPFHFYFSFDRPRNIYQYEENLGIRLKFNQHLTMIQIDNAILNEPLLDSSKMLRAQYFIACKQLINFEKRIGFLQQAATFIERTNSNLEETAHYLNLSPSTFKRKLKSHGTSFQQLCDHIRCQTAVFDLSIRQTTNENTARRLNFSDLTNFRRSFKRWTGLTPSDVKHS